MDNSNVFAAQPGCVFEALKSFFSLSQNALFIANQQKREFLYFNQHFELLFTDQISGTTTISFDQLFELAYVDDRHLLEKLLTSSDPIIFNPEGENIRFVSKQNTNKVYNVRCGKLITENNIECISGIMTDMSDILWFEHQQKKNDKTFRELSFITSHELRHEYAKIQSIVQMLDNPEINLKERNEMISAARKSIQVINSTIFKINHKLSFNQTDGYFNFYKRNQQYKKVILIDDDAFTNIINKRIIEMVDSSMEVLVFDTISSAEAYLQINDNSGDFLILLDVNFPFSSGWEFLLNYQRYSVNSKVIVLSSSIDTYDRDKAREFPMVVDYITKPLSLEMVKEILNTYK